MRLTSDVVHLAREFDTIGYQWSELMSTMTGNEYEVLCLARENRDTTIVGLPSPDGSQGGVWYFPTTVLERDGAQEAAKQAREYRWDL